MLDGLDGMDIALLAGAAFLSVGIAYADFRTRQFPLVLWGGLTAVGLAWCLKQGFWPVALVPIGIGAGALFLWNRFVKRVIGEGDLLLFLTAGLFLPVTELDCFLVLAGLGGLLVAGGLRIKARLFPVQAFAAQAFPFSGALLFAMLATLGLTIFLG